MSQNAHYLTVLDIICIVEQVVGICLEERNELVKEDGATWNSGGEFGLAEIVRRLQENKTDLAKLKEIIINFLYQKYILSLL